MHLNPALRLSVVCLTAVLGQPLSGTAAEEKSQNPTGPNPTKPYVLFMGADVSVQREKRFHRVEDVAGSELKIRVGKREVFVPTRNRATNLKVDNSLKLAHGSVTLHGLESGPAYTPGNDPVRKMIAASGAAGGAAAVKDLAYGKLIAASMNMAMAGQSASASANSGSAGATAAAYAESQKQYESAMQLAAASNDTMLSSQYDTTQYVNKMYNELAEGNYDAMEVSFKISSAEELDDPHMIILFRFQEREAKPGEIGMLIHAEELDAVGPKPKYVRVRESGLPRGFKYVDCEVHIYNRGEEVATNASTKRVELTRTEALQYHLIDHLGTNKGATVPAAVVRGTLPLEQRRQLSLDQLNRTCYARVSAEGELIDVYADEGCNLKLDDAVTFAALREAFFKPALVKGKPVEGTARVRLADI
ncbi:MAG TPA: hypothetical protein VHN79_11065 [Lacunisphaera sp.]|nr:hypothetical protein [Lacunisphaera sp.]